jgi:hypothetical protein
MTSSLRIALVLGLAAAIAPGLAQAQVAQQRDGTASQGGARGNIPEVERNPGNAVGATRDGTGGNPAPTTGAAQGGSPRPPAAATEPSQDRTNMDRGRSSSGGAAPTR